MPLFSADRSHVDFLVAQPPAWDWDLFKAVAVLLRYDATGTTGMILNRPITSTVSRVWGESCSELRHCDEPLYLGGPAQGAFSAIHEHGALAQLEIAPGIFCSSELQLIRQLATQKTQPIRFFLGCIAWSRGQLEQQLARNVWRKVPARTSVIFASPHGLWERLHAQQVPPAPDGDPLDSYSTADHRAESLD